MTKTQIDQVLTENNISPNQWIVLDDFRPMIVLAMASKIFADSKKAVYRFNDTEQLLEVVYGRYVNKVFTTDSGETVPTKFIPDQFISYDIIAGFSISANYLGNTIYIN